MKALLILAVLGACTSHKAAPDAPPPTSPYVVFLNFGGVTLEAGDADATTNTATFFDVETVVPAYPGPDQDLIMTATQTLLAPYNVDLATTRPATGPYLMIVFTGTGPSLGYPSITGVAPLVCGPANASQVGLEFTFDGWTSVDHANDIAVMIGGALEIPFTTKPHDCMCWIASTCLFHSACTFGGADTPVDTTDSCSGAPGSINENALFISALGAHP